MGDTKHQIKNNWEQFGKLVSNAHQITNINCLNISSDFFVFTGVNYIRELIFKLFI